MATKDKEKQRQYVMRWRKLHKEKYNEYQRKYQRERKQILKALNQEEDI